VITKPKLSLEKIRNLIWILNSFPMFFRNHPSQTPISFTSSLRMILWCGSWAMRRFPTVTL
jgi:hypothetical protein